MSRFEKRPPGNDRLYAIGKPAVDQRLVKREPIIGTVSSEMHFPQRTTLQKIGPDQSLSDIQAVIERASHEPVLGTQLSPVPVILWEKVPREPLNYKK